MIPTYGLYMGYMLISIVGAALNPSMPGSGGSDPCMRC